MPRDGIPPLARLLRDDGADSIPSDAGLIPVEIEQCLLGSLLCRNKLYELIVDTPLRADHFGYAVHGRIFTALAKLIDNGDDASPVSLKLVFDRDATLAEIGGAEYLAKLAGCAVTFLNTRHYVTQIIDLARRRALVSVARDVIVDARKIDLERTASHIIEDLDRRLIGINEEATQNAPKPVSALIDAALATAERTYQAGGAVTGVPTGLVDLDRKLGGLHASDLVVVAGCTAMGKTALATGIAYAAARAGHRVLMFELEMSDEQLMQRLFAARTGISAERQRRGPLVQSDIDALVAAGTEFRSLPLDIDDTSGASVAQLRASALRYKRRHGRLDLVVVDYLQLLHSDRTRPENRVQEVSSITLGLQGLAKELRVPVIAVSQLSRSVESREDKRPHLPDLRDSGSIEQDAAVVLFVYRDEYYLMRDEPHPRANQSDEDFAARLARWGDKLNSARGIAEITIAKNRHGEAPQTVKVRFDGNRTCFENLALGATG